MATLRKPKTLFKIQHLLEKRQLDLFRRQLKIHKKLLMRKQRPWSSRNLRMAK